MDSAQSGIDRLRSRAYAALTSETGNLLPPIRLGKKAVLFLNDLVGQPLADEAELRRRAEFEAGRKGSGFEVATESDDDEVPVVLFFDSEGRDKTGAASIRKLLDEQSIRYDVRDVAGDLPTIEALHRESGGRPLPVVFVAGTAIGGADAVRRLLASGELNRLISARAAAIGAPPPGTGPLGDPAIAAQIYGTETCPWTGRARALLEREGVEFRFIDLDAPDGMAIADRLTPETRHNTQPWVFLRGEFVGGYNALDELTRLGQLPERTRAPDDESRDPRIKVVVADRPNSDEVAPAESGD